MKKLVAFLFLLAFMLVRGNAYASPKGYAIKNGLVMNGDTIVLKSGLTVDNSGNTAFAAGKTVTINGTLSTVGASAQTTTVITGDLTASGIGTIGGALGVTGLITGAAGETITGTSTMNGNAVVTGTLAVTGAITGATGATITGTFTNNGNFVTTGNVTGASFTTVTLTDAFIIANESLATTATAQSFGITFVDGTGAGVILTLPDGIADGQIKRFLCTATGNDVDLSITNHITSDPEIARFNAVGESLTLIWLTNQWHTLSLIGTSFP